MTIVCPYCEKRMNLKGAKPGQYKPKCSKCGRPFLLVVPADENAEPVIKALKKKTSSSSQGSKSKTVAEAKAQKTVAPSSQTQTPAAPAKAAPAATPNVADQTQVAIEQTIPAAGPTPSQTLPSQPAPSQPAAQSAQGMHAQNRSGQRHRYDCLRHNAGSPIIRRFSTIAERNDDAGFLSAYSSGDVRRRSDASGWFGASTTV